MSISTINTGIGFSRLFTRTLPGFFLIGTWVVIGDGVDLFLDLRGNYGILLLAVLGIITGEFLEMIRKRYFFVPNEFRRYVYTYRGKMDDLSPTGKLGETDREGIIGWFIRKLFKNDKRVAFTQSPIHDKLYFEISRRGHNGPVETSVEHLYMHILSDVESQMGSDIIDYRTMMEFIQNMKISSWFLSYVILIAILTEVDIASPSILALILVFILVLYPYFIIVKQSSSKGYFERLMIELQSYYSLPEHT